MTFSKQRRKDFTTYLFVGRIADDLHNVNNVIVRFDDVFNPFPTNSNQNQKKHIQDGFSLLMNWQIKIVFQNETFRCLEITFCINAWGGGDNASIDDPSRSQHK